MQNLITQTTNDNGYDPVKNPGHEIQEVTYHYTFGIDADIDGQGSDTVNEETHEFNKVKIAGEDYIESTSTKTSSTTMKSPESLAGAEFALYAEEALTTVLGTAASDANGHVQFRGLDEGTYYLKETKAPIGWTINDTVFKVEIFGDLDWDGYLKEYEINFFTKESEGVWKPAGSANYTATEVDIDEKTGEVTNKDIDKTVTPAEVVDTKLASLPSTGANTAILFTVIGLAGGGLALAFKKKRNA